MAHRNAHTTVHARRLIVQRHQAGWPAARIAEQLGVSRATVHQWIARHLADGDAGLEDRPSRPHSSPTRTSAGELGLVASTVGRILHRHPVPPLAAVDRAPANWCAAGTPVCATNPAILVTSCTSM